MGLRSGERCRASTSPSVTRFTRSFATKSKMASSGNCRGTHLMPMSDDQYRLMLEDAFERHIRGRLSESAYPSFIEPLERLLDRYRQAIQIANMLGQRRPSDPPEREIFQFGVLDDVQATLVSAYDAASDKLEDSGFVDALDEDWPLVMEHMKPEHLPQADLVLLRRIGDADPRPRLEAMMNRMNAGGPTFIARPSNLLPLVRDTLRGAPPGSNPPVIPPQAGQPAQPPRPPSSKPRWWKGLAMIGTGSVLSLFNCTAAASLFGFPISPVEAITSAATGIGMIAVGVGEFRRE
jgi:hypothetical protein